MQGISSLPREYGFGLDPGTTHTSRTIMLAELRRLLAACPASAGVEEYRQAIVEENVLGKPTYTTRRATFHRLREYYALHGIPLFRAMRDLWDADLAAQPLLACLCANARDPLLRATAPIALDAAAGDPITPQMLATAVAEVFPGRYNDTTLRAIGEHAASSWAQSGHLVGKAPKVRARAQVRPPATIYALFLGYLTGVRGDGLFSTFWCRLLDATEPELRAHAVIASRQGWLEYRHGGAVTDISFEHLLRNGTDILARS